MSFGDLPNVSELLTEEDVIAVRASLPRLKAGDPLQAYRWSLTVQLRRIRMKNAGHLPPSLVRSLIARAGIRCTECDYRMAHWENGRYPTIDHIKSLANGGTNNPENLRVICNRCNAKKGHRA